MNIIFVTTVVCLYKIIGGYDGGRIEKRIVNLTYESYLPIQCFGIFYSYIHVRQPNISGCVIQV